MPSYTISGRIVSPDGTPVSGIIVSVKQLSDLTTGPVDRGTSYTTPPDGTYAIGWTEAATPASPWDLFVHATNSGGTEIVESRLITDLQSTATVDLVFGQGTYLGRSEWERIKDPIDAVLNGYGAKDVPSSRLEWVSRRADVYPTLAAAYIQAHRLSDSRTVQAETCYACLRHGLPPDLPGLLRSGRAAWEDAIRAAWDERIIPLPGDGSDSAKDTYVTDELAALDELVVDNAVYEYASGVNRFSILETAGLSAADQRTFTEAWLANTGTLAQFWADLVTPLGSGKVADLQFTLQATTLVGNHLDTLAQLQVERSNAAFSTVADLAAWDQTAWQDFLDGTGYGDPVDPPETITGSDISERRQKYARALIRLVEDAYPTKALRHRLNAEGTPPTHTTELVGFFDNNADFDITTTNISKWVADNPTAFSYATDPTQARKDLEITQRVYRLTPRLGRYETAKALLEAGITSATDVMTYTRGEFRDSLAAVLPSIDHDQDKLAEEIWDNASRIHTSAVAMVSAFALAKSGAAPRPVANLGVNAFSGNGLDDLEAILGNLDYCACKHCRSVFSPAAYLADLLKFLDDREFLADLRERRPDIEHILLDCDNTNTPLPQIDLAIELLERRFGGTLDDSSPQTTWSAPELAAHPEHIEAGVYTNDLPESGTKLSEWVHPWVLPFLLPWVEISTYLGHLGTDPAELRRLFVSGAGAPTAKQIAAAELGLSEQHWQIISGEWEGNASEDDREFWGFEAADNDWVTTLASGDPGQLVRRGQYRLDELIELFELTFIDPNNYTDLTKIEFQWSESCSLADATISNLSSAALDRLHRFTRLQRALGIPPRMLNVLIEHVGSGTLDEDFLLQLPHIIALHERTRLDYDMLATWWSVKIDARAYASGPASLYHRRFLAPELAAPETFLPTNEYGVALDGDADELLSENELAIVLAAARVSADDYTILDSIGNENVFTSADFGKLRFSFFTELMRASSFMRAFKLSARDFAVLATFVTDPFESPQQVIELIAKLDRIRATKLSLTHLAWLLRHEFVNEHSGDESTVARVFIELARGLRTIEAETAALVDPDGEATRANLGTVIDDSEDLDKVMAFLANTSALPDLDHEQLIDDYFGSFTDIAVAKTKLFTDGGELGDLPEHAPARYTWVLAQFISSSRRRTLLEDLAARQLAITPAAAEALLFENTVRVLADPGADRQLADVFLTDFVPEDDIASPEIINSTEYPNEFKAWTRLSKAATVVRTLDIDARQIHWYFDPENWLDLNELPLTPSDDKVELDTWMTLLAAAGVRKLFATPDGHQRLASALSLSEAVAVLVESNDWKADDVETLLGAPYLNWSTPGELAVPENLERLRQMADLATQAGVSLPRAWAWAHALETSFEIASEIKAAARAHHDDAQWFKVAPPLRNKIRTAQRDALVAAILAATPSIKDPDALSEELLIDVSMSPCMMTSRIKQAISSVQLFIQRAFIRLESGVEFTQDAGDLWEWMKNYRVWEANRKVFLYPENWIEPGLRSDKTPEFVALESVLNQDTLDEYRVERALSGYLETLATVSNLEIVGVWSDFTEHGSFAPPVEDLWVLGRTQNSPHDYYLRHRKGEHEWEPWEKVPLSIESDNVALVRHNDRLFLFWLLLDDATSTPGQDLSTVDAKQISIAWSELTQEGWSRINMSERTPAIRNLTPDPKRQAFRLQFWTVRIGVRLLVMRQHLSTREVQPLLTFDYDAVAKRIFLSGGGTFDANEPSNAPYIDDRGRLKHHSVIALQPWYIFSGQRYEKRNAEAIKFSQGAFDSVLFKKSPTHALAAFVHQADLWDPGEHKLLKYCPVVYDDRRRKYLLEPTQKHVGLSTEGNALSPDKLGTIDIAGYLACLPTPEIAPMIPGTRLPEAQKARDRVGERKAFSAGGVPGQEPEAAEYHAENALIIVAGNEEAALSEAANTQNGNVGFTGTNDEPDLFWLKMEPLYHPFAHALVHRLSRHGLPGIYDSAEDPALFRQGVTATPLDSDGLNVSLLRLYNPNDPPIEEFDFDFGTTYGVYNWEIFYHVPTLIASKLTTDQRFAEAQMWLHRIFDPIRVVEGEDGPEKFWRIKPFYEQATELAQDKIEAMLGIGVTGPEQTAAVDAFEKEVDAWRANPFDPHAIARIRPGVYQRALLMQYFDNLIAWADNLFRRDTIESINEATMLYMLVGHLLGERPQEVPGPDSPGRSYADLVELGLDEFANAVVALENLVLPPRRHAKLLGCHNQTRPGRRRVNIPIRLWYFCYPPNPELLKYWDIIQDRLWKIRHCQNIDGVVRQLPLFQPPIDPALLVQAVAAGVDLTSALAELDSGLPPYRFRYVWGRAQTVVGELRSLGGALLSALEKRDAEKLAVLRSGQEVSLLESVREVRIQRVQEAEAALESLLLSRDVIVHRRDYYLELGLGGLSSGEQDNLDRLEQARNLQIVAQVHSGIGAILALIPNLMIGTGAFADWGGNHLGSSISASAALFNGLSAEQSYQAGKSLTNAQYIRRADDWQFQAANADKDIKRIDQDIATAKLRIAIARREVEDHDLQIANARDVDRHMHDKYTDRELYDWMEGELATLYFQTYQLAFDLAKRAERAYRRELAISEQTQTIIKYGYWDSLRKGLLVGERLGHDLARLDIAYMDNDMREYELRKSVSLAQLAPAQLLALQETGECDIDIPEWLYDLDHPGHYLRRIRAVRVTIPAVVGPHTTLGARLQLVSHATRIKPDVDPQDTADYLEAESDDPRFVHGYGSGQAIATSNAMSDAGVFNLDFKDERYLPFEYAGAVSSWKLLLPDPSKAPLFDYRTISDVVVHIDYTAREGGDVLRNAALTQAAGALEEATGGYQLLAVHDAFPNEWEAFLSPEGESPDAHTLLLPITADRFPYFAQRKGFVIDQVDVHMIMTVANTGASTPVDFYDDHEDEDPIAYDPAKSFVPGEFPNTIKVSFNSLTASAQTWKLEIATAGLDGVLDPDTTGVIDRSRVVGMLLVIHYTLN